MPSFEKKTIILQYEIRDQMFNLDQKNLKSELHPAISKNKIRSLNQSGLLQLTLAKGG